MEADYEAEEAELSAQIAAAEVEYTKALKAEEEARRKAEEALFDGTVVHYEHWKARADADPHWAAENPFSVCVGRNASGELEPTFLPTALWKGQK